jgi:Fe-S-cluster containining protein
MAYSCERCGLCCQNLKNSDLYTHLHNGDGICRYLNRVTKSCSIYENRPLICRIDDYYEKYLKTVLTREEYYDKNKASCKMMQRI